MRIELRRETMKAYCSVDKFDYTFIHLGRRTKRVEAFDFRYHGGVFGNERYE